MAFGKLRRNAREAWEVPRDLLLGRYPEFVTGAALPRGHVPVFVFHSLDPEVFGAKVRYLADNGYVTLSVDEYFQVLLGTRPAPEKAVVLTFDDGRSSVRTVGLPILRRHGMKGVVFIVPGRTVSWPGPLPQPGMMSARGPPRARTSLDARRPRTPFCRGRRSTTFHARASLTSRAIAFPMPGSILPPSLRVS